MTIFQSVPEIHMNTITQLYASLPDRDFSSRHSSEYIKFAQCDIFFHLQVAKQERINNLKNIFQKKGVGKVYLSANLAGFCCVLSNISVEVLAKNFFHEPDENCRSNKRSQLEGCIVIINNNDVSDYQTRSEYVDFYSQCKSTCFIAWDWDNHHWLDLSTFLAAHSDIYAPAHHENLYLLSRFNWLIVGPVYCSSVQWSRNFLTNNIENMLMNERSNLPLGMHIPYAQFGFRIQVISTLNRFYPSIGFSSRAFHDRSPLDKLLEWCAHKTHWITPVLNDVPIRLFDALITGGIALVPDSMRFLPPVSLIPLEWIAFYAAADIVSPHSFVERANALFDKHGKDGIVARHRYALEHHHGDVSVKKMIFFAKEVLSL